MKSALKILLRKNRMAIDPNEFNAQVDIMGSADINFILDEMVKDGLCVSRQTALEIISHFNRKSANLVVSGYEVNTGLVNMYPLVKGPINRKKWDPKINWIDVSVFPGQVLYKAISETKVEIVKEKEEDPDSAQNEVDEMSYVRNSDFHNSLLNSKEVPACGIAFRTWLCKS